LETQLQKRNLTIDYLTEQLSIKRNQQACTIDLLDI
jgi:hypothetical protein